MSGHGTIRNKETTIFGFYEKRGRNKKSYF